MEFNNIMQKVVSSLGLEGDEEEKHPSSQANNSSLSLANKSSTNLGAGFSMKRNETHLNNMMVKGLSLPSGCAAFGDCDSSNHHGSIKNGLM